MSLLKKTYDTRKLHAEINKKKKSITLAFILKKRKNNYFKKMLLMQDEWSKSENKTSKCKPNNNTKAYHFNDPVLFKFESIHHHLTKKKAIWQSYNII